MSERFDEALEDLRGLLADVLSHAETCSYGYFHGGDPTTFSPDHESCSAEEIEAHRIACEKWAAGDKTPNPGPHRPLPDGSPGWITVASFGVGMNHYQDEEMTAWADTLSRCIERLEAYR